MLSSAENSWSRANVESLSSYSSSCLNYSSIDRIWHKTHRKSHGICKYCHNPDISNGSLIDVSTSHHQIWMGHVKYCGWCNFTSHDCHGLSNHRTVDNIFNNLLNLLRLTSKKISKIYTTCQSSRRVISGFAAQKFNNAESTHGWSVHLPHKMLMIQKGFLSQDFTCAPQTLVTGIWSTRHTVSTKKALLHLRSPV